MQNIYKLTLYIGLLEEMFALHFACQLYDGSFCLLSDPKIANVPPDKCLPSSGTGRDFSTSDDTS